MKTIQGPGIFLAQFIRDEEPYNNLPSLSSWVSSLGYTGVQIPSWDKKIFDLDMAAESKTYCDEVKGICRDAGLTVIELGSYIEGQVMAIHPAYAEMFAPFHPSGLNSSQRTEWATNQLKKAVLASKNLETKNVSTLSGGLAWHMIYPWPQRPPGIIDEAFIELSKRWQPVLDLALDNDITIGFELHPGSDLYDGLTYEMFLDKTGNHKAACITYDPSHLLLQQMDYLEFIRIYGEKIKMFHVKDAEFRPDGRVGVYGGYQEWENRAGRFRSLGDGQVDFHRIFSLLTQIGYDGWATLEWECCLKSPQQGAAEGAPFIQNHIIQVTNVAFDDFAGAKSNRERNKRILGL